MASAHSITVLKFLFLLFFCENSEKNLVFCFFFKSPIYCYLSININSYRMHESHSHTESKFFWFFPLRWAVIEISTPPVTYLFFEELRLRVIFAYKVFEINNFFLMHFKSVFYINIYNNKLFKKFTKIAFFWASKPEWSLNYLMNWVWKTRWTGLTYGKRCWSAMKSIRFWSES